MPGTAYYNLGKWISNWLEKVPESRINTSSEDVSRDIKKITLNPDECLISFDVTQLYTYVPLEESILMAATKLFQIVDDVPVNIDTFIKLTKLACSNILIKTHRGYIRQVDGLAMGIQCAPQLANIWMSAFDGAIRGKSQFYKRYMDDCIRTIEKNDIEITLGQINNLHPNLSFTKEEEDEGGTIPFLDMKLRHKPDGKVESEWYRKKTDTGLTINFHALAPMKYKRSMIINMVHRIYNSTSSWPLFHKGIDEAKTILEYNQYPKVLYEKIIFKTLEKIIIGCKKAERDDDDTFKNMVFIQYRGGISDTFVRKLRDTGAPIKPILTLRKVKSVLPTLKQNIDKLMTSNIVYEFTCPNCKVSYVGMTSRHLCTRIKEHQQNGENQTAIKEHTELCLGQSASPEHFKILEKIERDIWHLSVTEALFIREKSPQLNTRDEFRSRQLRLKI